MNFFVLLNTKEDILKKVCNQAVLGHHWLPKQEKKNTMEVNGASEQLCFPHSSEYLPLCSAEQRHSYRFGTSWGWANYDRIVMFGWNKPLTKEAFPKKLGDYPPYNNPPYYGEIPTIMFNLDHNTHICLNKITLQFYRVITVLTQKTNIWLSIFRWLSMMIVYCQICWILNISMGCRFIKDKPLPHKKNILFYNLMKPLLHKITYLIGLPCSLILWCSSLCISIILIVHIQYETIKSAVIFFL